jgi:hypothetical protein
LEKFFQFNDQTLGAIIVIGNEDFARKLILDLRLECFDRRKMVLVEYLLVGLSLI